MGSQQRKPLYFLYPQRLSNRFRPQFQLLFLKPVYSGSLLNKYVCACMLIHMHMHGNMRTHVCAYMHTETCTSAYMDTFMNIAHTDIYIFMYTCIKYMHGHACTDTCIHAHSCMYAHNICIYIEKHAHVYMNKCTFVHTCIHANTQPCMHNTYIHAQLCIHTHGHACIHAYMYIYKEKHGHSCIHGQMHFYACTHRWTHTHMCIMCMHTFSQAYMHMCICTACLYACGHTHVHI